MFTGLVEEVGTVLELKRKASGGILRVKCSLQGVEIGESVAVNGACLTVVEVGGDFLTFELSPETLKRTNLSLLKRGDEVNLERALSLGDRLGGHIVQGHVDFTATLKRFRSSGEHKELILEIPPEWAKYFVEKGSVAVDGISLTVNSVRKEEISINIIPHTFNSTNLRSRKEGDKLNIEVDILGKYVINYLERLSAEDRLENLLREFLR